jgi:molybdopterin/thiamine biosynthesis adenylyltransferase
MTIEQWAEFNNYHARNREQSTQLRQFVVLCIGVGATGSHVAGLLAKAGCSLVLFDRDTLDHANLTRHYITDRDAIGQPKSHALARKIRGEVPALQSVRGVRGDIEKLSDADLRALLRGASLVLGSSGRDAVDHRLNAAARDLGLPLVVPSLWADNQAQLLGDIHVVAWHLGDARRGACFECLRPATADAPAAAEAQRGMGAEVVRVASLAAEVVLGLLLVDSPQRPVLMRQLSRGAGYFVIPRWPPALRAVITRPRRSCPACTTATRAGHQPTDLDPATIRDWSIAAALGSVVLWHQSVPGLDVAATFAFVASIGLWWRGRLPSFQQTSALVRRHLGMS